jgi:thioredoxin reductase (NADPH)
VLIETPSGKRILKNDFVFALIGYHPDFEFLEAWACAPRGRTGCPSATRRPLESNVPGSIWQA